MFKDRFYPVQTKIFTYDCTLNDRNQLSLIWDSKNRINIKFVNSSSFLVSIKRIYAANVKENGRDRIVDPLDKFSGT